MSKDPDASVRKFLNRLVILTVLFALLMFLWAVGKAE